MHVEIGLKIKPYNWSRTKFENFVFPIYILACYRFWNYLKTNLQKQTLLIFKTRFFSWNEPHGSELKDLFGEEQEFRRLRPNPSP